MNITACLCLARTKKCWSKWSGDLHGMLSLESRTTLRGITIQRGKLPPHTVHQMNCACGLRFVMLYWHICTETKWTPFCRRHFQIHFLNEKYESRIKLHWSRFLKVQLMVSQHWFKLWLGANQATSHHLKQWWLVYWRIYASLGLNESRRIWIP